MADKSTQLILSALARAAAEPSGLPLHAHKNEPGLFPATGTARTAAERARNDGLIRITDDPVRGREVCALTEKGMQFLVRNASPRQVLEDFVRALEDRQAAIDTMASNIEAMSTGLQDLRAAVEHVLPRLTEPGHTNGAVRPRPSTNGDASAHRNDGLIADIKARLSEWHAAAGASQDCPLPDLYRRLESGVGTTIGRFHDALRQLHDDHQIYLHPWTGPLYALPEPVFALLIGHEVAFYASIR